MSQYAGQANATITIKVIDFLSHTATPIFYMNEFDKYFSEKTIVRLIAKYRIKLATKRHDIHILNGIRTTQNNVNPITSTIKKIDPIILKITPPRSKWLNLSKINRLKYKNNTQLNIGRLEKVMINYLKNYKKNKNNIKEDWVNELHKFINDIINSIENINIYEIEKPIILKEKKDKENKADKRYRPIAHYKSLKDKIIIGQIAKYLTDNLDNELSQDSVFAFRSAKGRLEPITHHDTVSKILEYINKHKGQQLWVSECDIRKFYDCVNHETAKQSLLEIIQRFEKNNKRKIDARAITVFNKYLDSYSFNETVYPLNKSQEMIKINGKFEWEEDNLIKLFYNSGIHEKIGVPQGGAISCLIANLILDKVDKEVLKENLDTDLLYMRYCDDMVLIHIDKDKCNKALERYMNCLNECKLICHPPIEINSYNKEFWDFKSKKPYPLGEKNNNKVPWLSFVGYQIRYNGMVRIRNKSLRKEIQKQKNIVNQIAFAVKTDKKESKNNNSRRSIRQIMYRAEQKLIATSVGKMNLRDEIKTDSLKPSWTVGFKKLNKNPIVEKQLKKLDRNRTFVLRSLKKQLKKIDVKNKSKLFIPKEKFFGSPFSYHNFIMKK